MNIKLDAKIFYKKVALFTNVYLIFCEQQKNVSQDVLDRYAGYYALADQSISTDIYKSVVDNLLQSNLFDNHKLFLAGLVFMRGLWKDSKKIICAKDPDGDCGNYVLNLTYLHQEEKYGAMKIQNLLEKPCVQKFLDTILIYVLYPRLAQSVLSADSMSDEHKDHNQPVVENKETVPARPQLKLVMLLKFIFFPMLWILNRIFSFFFGKSRIVDNHKKESDALVDVQKNQSANQEQVADLVDSYKDKHPLLAGQEPYIRLQINDFSSAISKVDALKAIYENAQYCKEYLSYWFKYWHLKEALMAAMFDKKIRIFVGSEHVEEITPAEPVYSDDSQEVCVWTDSVALHDSELINPNYFVRIAQSISYERCFWQLFDNNTWLKQWPVKFAEYEKRWLDG